MGVEKVVSIFMYNYLLDLISVGCGFQYQLYQLIDLWGWEINMFKSIS